MIIEYTRYKIADEERRQEFEHAYEKAQAAFIASTGARNRYHIQRREG